jgi:hypothetical protein
VTGDSRIPGKKLGRVEGEPVEGRNQHVAGDLAGRRKGASAAEGVPLAHPRSHRPIEVLNVVLVGTAAGS